MHATKKQNFRRAARARRTSVRIRGSAKRPRLSVFRSNKGMYAQLIDDAKGHTIASVSSMDVAKKGKKTDIALSVGEAIAKKAARAGITAAVFDRRSYRFHGRVKALAEGARRGGLQL